MRRRAAAAVLLLVLTACATSDQTEGPTVDKKPACEKCKATLAADAEAYHCSYNCTFCADCTKAMKQICPNCGGELIRR